MRRTREFLKTYRAALAVFAVVALAAALDYGFRARTQDQYTKGLAALGAGRFDEAITAFGKALRQNPADPAARAGLAQAYQAKGWLDEAEQQYEQAIKRATETLELAYLNSGQVAERKGKRDDARLRYRSLERLKTIDR